jgi:hypothetical protein
MPGLSAIARRHAPAVSSLLPPSTKMSSAALPKSGKRSTSTGMLPASLRQAQITETLASAGSGSGTRATTQLVRQSQRNGRKGASTRLASGARPGTRTGSRMRESSAVMS